MIEEYKALMGTIDDERMNELCDLLNDGYEALSINTSWVEIGTNGHYVQEPNMIAILVKRK